MTPPLPRLGMVFDREFPAGQVVEVAGRVEAAGLDELWLIEDCFYTAGVSLSAAALATTASLHVGLGVMPAVARTPAITAMEIATLAELAPGRFTAGIGHGVQSWMAQMGARTPSPLTTLDETVTSVRRLLRGEEVSLDGRQVTLDRVRLEQPPSVVPPVLAGVQQERSLALAGRVADGVVFGEGTGPAYVRWALEQAERAADDFEVVTFTLMSIADDRREAYAPLVEFVAGLVAEQRPSLRVLPFWDDLRDRVARAGPAALLDMPADHWHEIGAIGTREDAVAHFGALREAGVRCAAVFPGTSLEHAHAQIDSLVELAGA